MFIVQFRIGEGFFGPFETRGDGEQYLKDCKSQGKVIALVKPYAFGKLEGERDGRETVEGVS